jgi:hypothetical protein
MPRTAFCRVCLEFVTAPSTSAILIALRDHALENLDTHRMTELTAVDADTEFTNIVGRTWGVLEALKVKR